MKVYIINGLDYHIKILKKKISYEGLNDRYRRNLRAMSTKIKREQKRIKKHAFRSHLYASENR